MKKNLSKILRIMLVLVVASSFGFVPKAQAAALSAISDTIEDSRPSTASNHTIRFTTTSVVNDDGSTITVTFPAGFTLTSIVENDIDLEDDGVDKTTAADCTGSEEFSAAVSGQVLTLAACSGDAGDIAAGSVVDIKIGDHAAGSGTGTNKITNHATPAVYTIAIGGTFGDTGNALIVIIATNTASVTIAETLAFTVTAQTPAQCDPYSNTGTEITTTATTIPFATVNSEAFYEGCQTLDVSTNAASGYTVSVKESDQLTSGGNTIADGACDGACSETAEAAWATATNNGFGYCMNDETGNGAETADAGWADGANGCESSSTFFKLFSELNVDSPEQQTIMSSTTPVNDISDIGYRISIDSLQAAGTYTNAIIFVATPTY